MCFAPGQCGNPACRLHGTRNHAMQVDDGVCPAVVRAAKSSDMTAARIIIERLIPTRRTRPVEIDLPRIETAVDVVAGHPRIVQAMAEHDMLPDEAQAICVALEDQSRAIDTLDLAQRVAAFNARLSK